jgi:hypothetical protein
VCPVAWCCRGHAAHRQVASFCEPHRGVLLGANWTYARRSEARRLFFLKCQRVSYPHHACTQTAPRTMEEDAVLLHKCNSSAIETAAALTPHLSGCEST